MSKSRMHLALWIAIERARYADVKYPESSMQRDALKRDVGMNPHLNGEWGVFVGNYLRRTELDLTPHQRNCLDFQRSIRQEMPREHFPGELGQDRRRADRRGVNRTSDVARARHDKPVMTALPIPADVPVLDGQAALFESPDSLLTLEVADLRTLAAHVGAQTTGMLAQMRRYIGLLAWAGWHRLALRDYTEFVAGLADAAGVTARSVETWRDAQVSAGGLAIPAVVVSRKRVPKDKSAGQRATFEKTSNFVDNSATPIPAASRDAQEQTEAPPRAAVPPIEPPVAQPVDAPEADSPVEPDARPCPFCGLSADDGPLIVGQEIAQVFGLLRNLDPPEFFASMSDAQRDELREFIGRMNPAKRSPGHVITAEDDR